MWKHGGFCLPIRLDDIVCGRCSREGRRSQTARPFEYPGTGWVKYHCQGLGDWRFPVKREDTRETQFKLMGTMLIKPVYSNYFMVSKSLNSERYQ